MDEGKQPAGAGRKGPRVEIVGDRAALERAFAGINAKIQIPPAVVERITAQLKPLQRTGAVERALEEFTRSTTLQGQPRISLGPTTQRMPTRIVPRQASSADVNSMAEAVVSVLTAMRADQRVSNRRMFWMNVALVIVGTATAIDIFLR